MANEPVYLTTDQMREVDRLMIEDYGITLFQMMENAGRALARLARQRFLEGNPEGKRVVIAAGSGGNGGGGLVCARNLHNWGAEVHVFVSAPDDDLGDVPEHQIRILRMLEVEVTTVSSAIDLPEADLVVDAMIGYSLSGAPRGTPASLIRVINDQSAPVLSLDVPSGVDAATGEVLAPAVRATATMTLAMPKEGLRAVEVKEYVGELYLADIGVPPSLYRSPSLRLKVGPVFAEEDIVKLFAPVEEPPAPKRRGRG
jgi:NAD(P)H-hydrate epimerase